MRSDEQAERVRAGITAFSRGEIDETVAGFHPDVRWEVSPDLAPDAATYRGHDGVRTFWRQWREAFEGFQLQVEECFPVAEDRVIAVTRAQGRGAGSGAPVVSASFAQLFDLRDGTVVRVRLFASREAAVRAAEADATADSR